MEEKPVQASGFTVPNIKNNYYRIELGGLLTLCSNLIYMNTKNPTPSVFAGLTKFVNEICYALFVSSDKREFQRLKNFIGS